MEPVQNRLEAVVGVRERPLLVELAAHDHVPLEGHAGEPRVPGHVVLVALRLLGRVEVAGSSAARPRLRNRAAGDFNPHGRLG